jgi:hypothetical protein
MGSLPFYFGFVLGLFEPHPAEDAEKYAALF